MNKKTFSNYQIYDSVYGDDTPFEQVYLVMFDKIPSKHTSPIFYQKNLISFLLTNNFIIENKIVNTNRTGRSLHTYILTNSKNESIIKFYEINDNKNELYKIEILYSIHSVNLDKLFDWELMKEYEITKKKSNINLIKYDGGHLDTVEYDLQLPNLDVILNYGSEFHNIHETIVKRLNTRFDKGIILLHGDPGTGKTTYIKYLTGIIKEKEILFIPPTMAEAISEPSMIPFLMEHKNSILIIEDAERVIGDRENNGSSTGVSNILNLTDGILGDCLGIQIIATFNMKREKIDQALLRKGRLIAEHKFEKLNVNDTNKLLKHLGKDHSSKEGMVLADIYNIDVKEFKSKQPQKIGF